jgi:hypothetical protein
MTGQTPNSASRLHRFDRWMYRGGRPNRLARVLNRISAIQFSAGILAPKQGVTLDVRGRRAGRIISFPLVVADGPLRRRPGRADSASRLA